MSFFKKIAWKKRGKWDYSEIIIDLALATILVIGVLVLTYK